MPITNSVSLKELVQDDSSFALFRLFLRYQEQLEEKQQYFAQSKLINSKNFDQYSDLKSFVLRFSGLCELISNAVISEDLLGYRQIAYLYDIEEFDIQSHHGLEQLILKTLQQAPTLGQKITLPTLMDMKKTHIVDTTFSYQRMFAGLLGIIPFSLFSAHEYAQQKDGTINRVLLRKKFDALNEGAYIKFMAYTKSWMTFHGHSMVIKKTGETYSFFDPNGGEKFNLTFDALCLLLEERGRQVATNVKLVFMDGQKYVSSLIRRHRLSAASVNKPSSNFLEVILQKIEKIAQVKPSTDHELIACLNTLKEEVEQYLTEHCVPEKELLTAIPNMQKNTTLNLNNTVRRLRELDCIRINLSENHLKNLLEDIIFKERSGKIPELAAMIHTPFDFIAVINYFSKEHTLSPLERSSMIANFLEHLAIPLPVLLSEFRYLGYLMRSQLLDDLLFPKLKAHLVDNIHSIQDFFEASNRFGKTSRDLLYETFQPKLVQWLHHYNDLIYLCRSLTQQQLAPFIPISDAVFLSF